MIYKIKNVIYSIMYWLFRLLPIQKNKLLFLSGGTGYGCNPKYLADYLATKSHYDIVWAFSPDILNKCILPTGMRKVRYLGLRYLYEISTAGAIIDNHRLPFKKRKEQKYIQTWHSSMRLKKIEGDALENLDEGYIEMAKKDSDNIDLILSGCEFSTDFFRRAFWYNGEVAKTGTPRIDFIMADHPEIRHKVAKYFKTENRFVLYAPTFRKNKDVSFYNINSNMITERLEKTVGGMWTVLLRLHPSLLTRSCELKQCSKQINATTYSDIQELIIVSEFVITDYSSLMFDCAFIHKPCILYMPDYEEYIQKERGLYFDIAELPFPKAFSENELAVCLGSFDKEKYDAEIDEFLKQIGSYEDGHACERISKIIDDMLKG